MDYFNANVKLLNSKFPKLAKFIEQESLESEYDYEVLKAKNGQPTLQTNINGNKIYLHSAYNPENEAKGILGDASYLNSDIVLVFGMGLGYQLQEIVQRAADKKVHIFVIEKDPMLLKIALESMDINKVLNYPWLNFYVNLSVADIYALLWTNLRVDLAKNIYFVDHSSSMRLYKEYYDEVLAKVRDIVSLKLSNIATVISFKGEWIKNSLTNLLFVNNSPGVDSLQDKAKNIPAIIVSAGPSLDKNIKYLQKAKGKALIIAVGTSLRTLFKENITPDLVITCDSSEKNYQHFKGLNYNNLPLVFEPVVYPQILEDHSGLKFAFDTNQTVLADLVADIKNKGSLLTGGSVANCAFSLVLKMGCNPVILIGQDLSFTEGRTHTNASIYGQDRVKKDDTLSFLEVPGYLGGQVLTNRTFFAFIKWFENIIQQNKDRLFINATEGGAKIEGTEQMTLQESIEKYCISDIRINNLFNEVSNNFVPEELIKLKKELTEIEGNLLKLSKESKEAADLSEVLEKMYRNRTYDSGRVKKAMRKMDTLDESIKNNSSSGLLNEIIQDVILASERGELVKEDKNDDDFVLAEKRALSMKKFYTAIYKACREEIPWFRETLDKINIICRKEEDKCANI